MGAILSLCLLLTLAFGATTSGAIRQTAARRPNVIFILVDDMGYGDLGSYGVTDIRTPQLDRLAREGVRLTNCYANGPVCTPARAAFITGRYQQRVGLEWALTVATKEPGLPVSETSIARMLKNDGYRTALFGKWRLGYKPEFGPNAHGFDEFFGILGGNVDQYSHKVINGEPDLYEQTQPIARPGAMCAWTMPTSGGATCPAQAGNTRKGRAAASKDAKIIRSSTALGRMRRPTRSGLANDCQPKRSLNSPRAGDRAVSSMPGDFWSFA